MMANVIDPPTLILTRPREAAEHFADKLGWPVDWPLVYSPVLKIERMASADLPKDRCSVILTSENAAFALRHMTVDRAYCVGPQTAAVVKGAADQVLVGSGGAQDLLRLILEHPPETPLLYLRGETVSFDLCAALDEQGVACAESIVYRQKTQALTAEAQSALIAPWPVILPVFSALSASLVTKSLEYRGPLHALFISANVARAFSAKGVERHIAASPDARGMIEGVRGVVARNFPPSPWVEGPGVAG